MMNSTMTAGKMIPCGKRPFTGEGRIFMSMGAASRVGPRGVQVVHVPWKSQFHAKLIKYPCPCPSIYYTDHRVVAEIVKIPSLPQGCRYKRLRGHTGPRISFILIGIFEDNLARRIIPLVDLRGTRPGIGPWHWKNQKGPPASGRFPVVCKMLRFDIQGV